MRALASQEVLTLRSLAATFGVSRMMVGAASFCGEAPAGATCVVMGFVPFGLMGAEAPPIRISGLSLAKMDESSPIYTATNLISAKGNFVVAQPCCAHDACSAQRCCVQDACSAQRHLENATPSEERFRARVLHPIANPSAIRLRDLC